MQKIYSEREAERITKISRKTIRKYRKLGYLKPIETPHAVLYDLNELIKFQVAFRDNNLNSLKSH